MRYSPENNGGAAVFYSNATPAERHDLEKIARLRQLEPLMKEIEARNPLVASLYFNSWDSFNHIYPWFFTLDQYPADMDIPSTTSITSPMPSTTRSAAWSGPMCTSTRPDTAG